MKTARAPEITIGFRVGRLVVAWDTGERKNGYRVWQCRCDFGQETLAVATQLTQGYKKSCGRLVRSNTSGHNGVYFNRRSEKWAAQIGFKGRTYYLGSFENIDDAVAARQEAEKRIYGGFLEWYYRTHPRA